MNIIMENAMIVDTTLKGVLEHRQVKIDKEYTGLKFMDEIQHSEMLDDITSHKDTTLYLATTYMNSEYIEEMFDYINESIKEVNVIIYDDEQIGLAIVGKFSQKYPNTKFNLISFVEYDEFM